MLARSASRPRRDAEALEGLSWAAWWLDDAETVFSARERAYRLYRERGDPAAAARMATWIGVDQNDFHGAAAVAIGLVRARAAAARTAARRPRARLARVPRGLPARRASAARARGAPPTIGRRFGVPDLEMLGLALEGALARRGRARAGGDARGSTRRR